MKQGEKESLRFFLEVGGEADAAPLRWGWVHQFADHREDGGDGAFAAEDRGEHGHTLLGEGVRRVAATAATGF